MREIDLPHAMPCHAMPRAVYDDKLGPRMILVVWCYCWRQAKAAL
jgi:hypothetical protein